MKELVASGLIAYLIVGALFSLATMPTPTWRCPAPQEPHGYITIGGTDDPSRQGCRATVTTGDQVKWFALATPAWLPLVASKTLSD